MTVACELTVKLVHGAEARIVEASPFYDDVLLRAAEADFRAPFKPRADILLVGHAYAPADEGEADRLLVRMRVGDFSKAVRVTGDRFWLREGGRLVPGAPRKFRRLLLSGERAARTPDNPLGLDPDAVPVEHRIAVPNLEPASAGYVAVTGPVPLNAPSRAGLVHPMMLGWVHALLAGQRAGLPPEGFNFGYFNIAPFDQQLPELSMGSAIVLEHVHPEHPVFTSRLPAVRPRAFFFDPQALQQVEVPLRFDTLWLDAEREIATLVFRGVVPISHPDLATQVMTRVEPFERAAPVAAPAMNATQMGVETVGAGLPFMKAPAGSVAPPRRDPVAQSAAHAPGKTMPPAPLPGGMYVTQEISVGPGLGALPFDSERTENLIEDPTTASNAGLAPKRAAAPPPAPPPPPPPSEPPTPRPYTPSPTTRATKRLVPPDIGPTPEPPLPERRPASEAPLSHTMPGSPLPRAPFAPTHGLPSVDVKATNEPMPMQSLALRPPPSTRLGAMALGTGKLASSPGAPPLIIAPPRTEPDGPATQKKPAHEAPAATAPRVDTPAPKAESSLTMEEPTTTHTGPGIETSPVIAPPTLPRPVKPAPAIFAKPDSEVTMAEELTDSSTADRRGLEARTLEEAEAEADRDAFEFPLPPSDGFEVDGVTLEHCAAIRAAIAMPGSDRGAVLAKHELDEASFAKIEKSHLARIDQETSGGVQDLLNRYDAAYVAAQDALRSPIGVKEYARIVVGRQEGDLADVMSELGVPRSELMRLDRVWKRRIAEHPGVDKTLKATIESLGKKR